MSDDERSYHSRNSSPRRRRDDDGSCDSDNDTRAAASVRVTERTRSRSTGHSASSTPARGDARSRSPRSAPSLNTQSASTSVAAVVRVPVQPVVAVAAVAAVAAGRGPDSQQRKSKSFVHFAFKTERDVSTCLLCNTKLATPDNSTSSRMNHLAGKHSVLHQKLSIARCVCCFFSFFFNY